MQTSTFLPCGSISGVRSNSEGRRAIEQGGVTVNGEKVADVKKTYTAEEINAADFIVKRGKKSFAKIVVK